MGAPQRSASGQFPVIGVFILLYLGLGYVRIASV
jgi:hypothetical protein